MVMDAGAMRVVVVSRGTGSRRAGADAGTTTAAAAAAAAARRPGVPRIRAAPGVRRRRREESEPVVHAGGTGAGRVLAGHVRRDVTKNAIYRRHLQRTSALCIKRGKVYTGNVRTSVTVWGWPAQ